MEWLAIRQFDRRLAEILREFKKKPPGVAHTVALETAISKIVRICQELDEKADLTPSDHDYELMRSSGIPVWKVEAALRKANILPPIPTVLPRDFLTHFGYDKDMTIAPVLLVDNNPDVVRAFATMRGPNTLGAYLLLPLLVAAYYLTGRRNIPLAATALILGLVALLLSGSRSAWLGLIIALTAFAVLLLPRIKLRQFIKFGAVPMLLVVGLLAWAAVSIPNVRLAVFHSSPGDPHLLEGSTQKHWEATMAGAKDIIENPFGSGLGSVGPASFYNSQSLPSLSENYFVQIGQEVGILGLLLFLVICWQVAGELNRRKDVMAKLLLASFIGLSVINLFLHGWADDPTAMTWWGLAGLAFGRTVHDPATMWFNKSKLQRL